MDKHLCDSIPRRGPEPGERPDRLPASRAELQGVAVTAVPGSARTRRATLDELLRGAHQLVIEFGGREYRLRATRNGKLILTA